MLSSRLDTTEQKPTYKVGPKLLCYSTEAEAWKLIKRYRIKDTGAIQQKIVQAEGEETIFEVINEKYF